jgi:general secretion pathway protein H
MRYSASTSWLCSDRRPADVHNRAAGFTLLELLLVVSILALVAAIAAPRLTSPAANVRLRSAGQQLVAALRLARAEAIARNGEAAVVVDADKRTIHRGGLVDSFAPDILVRLTIAESERVSAARGGFRFFPDGSSTGGNIRLALHGRELSLCVDWLTGKADWGAEC